MSPALRWVSQCTWDLLAVNWSLSLSPLPDSHLIREITAWRKAGYKRPPSTKIKMKACDVPLNLPFMIRYAAVEDWKRYQKLLVAT